MINLLPPQYKESLAKEEQFRVIFIVGSVFLIFLIALFLMLSIIRIYFSNQIIAQKILEESLKRDLELWEQEFKKLQEFSKDVSKVFNLYENRILLSLVLEHISQNMPQEISLTSLAFSPPILIQAQEQRHETPATLSLGGFSPTRELLSLFRANLQEDEIFSQVNFPLANFAKPLDIQFSANMRINQKALQKLNP